MNYVLTLTIDTDALSSFTDEYIAALWHAAQFNPAPIDDDQAGWLAEHIGREIIRRWLAATPPALWHHQGRHASENSMEHAQAAEAAPILPLPAPAIRPDWFYKGRAKLDAAGQQLPPDATDHAIVYDPATGLMEAIRAAGFDQKFNHDEAVAACMALCHAGYNDWQVPLINEAAHSVDYDFDCPAADPALYPDAVSDWYWTRQQTNWTKGKAGSSRSFFYVHLGDGGVFHHLARDRLRVRPVRRGVPASQWLILGPADSSSETDHTAAAGEAA